MVHRGGLDTNSEKNKKEDFSICIAEDAKTADDEIYDNKIKELTPKGKQVKKSATTKASPKGTPLPQTDHSIAPSIVRVERSRFIKKKNQVNSKPESGAKSNRLSPVRAGLRSNSLESHTSTTSNNNNAKAKKKNVNKKKTNAKRIEDDPQPESTADETVADDSKNSQQPTLSQQLPLTIICSVPLERLSGILDSLKIDKTSTKCQPSAAEDDTEDSANVDQNSSQCKTLCLYCDKRMSTVKMRARHIERFHTISKERRSSTRNPVPPSPDVKETAGGALPACSLSSAPSTPKSSTTQPFSGCSFCSKSPKLQAVALENDLSALFNHLVDLHSDKYFGCKLCAIRFQNAAKLEDHVQRTHSQLSKSTHPAGDVNPPQGPDEERSPSEVDKSTPTQTKTRRQVKQTGTDSSRANSDVFPQPTSRNGSMFSNDEPILSRLGVTQNRLPRGRKGIRSRRQTNVDVVKPDTSLVSVKTRSKVGRVCTSNEPIETVFRTPTNTRIEPLSCTFDEDFYEKVFINVRTNLSCHLDGKLGDDLEVNRPQSPPPLLPAIRSTVVKSQHVAESEVHTATSLAALTAFPTLLTAEQYGCDFGTAKIKRPITKHSWKWKWDSVKKYKYVNEGGKIVKKIKQPMLGLRDLSKLDMWTQLTMRQKHEVIHKQTGGASTSSRCLMELSESTREEKQKQINQLNTILDSRRLPEIVLEQNEQTIIKLEITDEGLQYLAEGLSAASCEVEEPSTSLAADRIIPANLNLIPSRSLGESLRNSVVLSGEWARPRCYVCFGCGARFDKLKALDEHKMFRHPHVYSTHYEIVGRELIEGNLYKHFFIPLKALSRHREYAQGILVNKKTEDSVSKSSTNSVNEEESLDSLHSVTASFTTLSSSKLSDDCDTDTKTAIENVSSSYTEPSMTNCSKNDNSLVVVSSSSMDCTKCKRNCHGMLELYRHMLDCSGDYAWHLAKKKKYRYYGSRKRRQFNKHSISTLHLHRRKVKETKDENDTDETPKKKSANMSPSTPRPRPSDADSIRKMLENLPPKRVCREIIPNATKPRSRKFKTAAGRKMQQNSLNKCKLSTTKLTTRSRLLRNHKLRAISEKEKAARTNKILENKRKSTRATGDITIDKTTQPESKTMKKTESGKRNIVRKIGATTKRFVKKIKKRLMGEKPSASSVEDAVEKTAEKKPAKLSAVRKLTFDKEQSVSEIVENDAKENPSAISEKTEAGQQQEEKSDKPEVVPSVSADKIPTITIETDDESKKPLDTSASEDLNLKSEGSMENLHQRELSTSTEDLGRLSSGLLHSQVSPTTKRRSKKINDCIAMLTGKLQEKLGKPFLECKEAGEGTKPQSLAEVAATVPMPAEPAKPTKRKALTRRIVKCDPPPEENCTLTVQPSEVQPAAAQPLVVDEPSKAKPLEKAPQQIEPPLTRTLRTGTVVIEPVPPKTLPLETSSTKPSPTKSSLIPTPLAIPSIAAPPLVAQPILAPTLPTPTVAKLPLIRCTPESELLKPKDVLPPLNQFIPVPIKRQPPPPVIVDITTPPPAVFKEIPKKSTAERKPTSRQQCIVNADTIRVPCIKPPQLTIPQFSPVTIPPPPRGMITKRRQTIAGAPNDFLSEMNALRCGNMYNNLPFELEVPLDLSKKPKRSSPKAKACPKPFPVHHPQISVKPNAVLMPPMPFPLPMLPQTQIIPLLCDPLQKVPQIPIQSPPLVFAKEPPKQAAPTHRKRASKKQEMALNLNLIQPNVDLTIETVPLSTKGSRKQPINSTPYVPIMNNSPLVKEASLHLPVQSAMPPLLAEITPVISSPIVSKDHETHAQPVQNVALAALDLVPSPTKEFLPPKESVKPVEFVQTLEPKIKETPEPSAAKTQAATEIPLGSEIKTKKETSKANRRSQQVTPKKGVSPSNSNSPTNLDPKQQEPVVREENKGVSSPESQKSLPTRRSRRNKAGDPPVEVTEPKPVTNNAAPAALREVEEIAASFLSEDEQENEDAEPVKAKAKSLELPNSKAKPDDKPKAKIDVIAKEVDSNSTPKTTQKTKAGKKKALEAENVVCAGKKKVSEPEDLPNPTVAAKKKTLVPDVSNQKKPLEPEVETMLEPEIVANQTVSGKKKKNEPEVVVTGKRKIAEQQIVTSPISIGRKKAAETEDPASSIGSGKKKAAEPEDLAIGSTKKKATELEAQANSIGTGKKKAAEPEILTSPIGSGRKKAAESEVLPSPTKKKATESEVLASLIGSNKKKATELEVQANSIDSGKKKAAEPEILTSPIGNSKKKVAEPEVLSSANKKKTTELEVQTNSFGNSKKKAAEPEVLPSPSKKKATEPEVLASSVGTGRKKNKEIEVVTSSKSAAKKTAKESEVMRNSIGSGKKMISEPEVLIDTNENKPEGPKVVASPIDNGEKDFAEPEIPSAPITTGKKKAKEAELVIAPNATGKKKAKKSTPMAANKKKTSEQEDLESSSLDHKENATEVDATSKKTESPASKDDPLPRTVEMKDPTTTTPTNPDTSKKPRRRRKNELAAIVADQLLESFKEVDKSRIDDLKRLENLAYEKSEDLLLTGMRLMPTTKRKNVLDNKKEAAVESEAKLTAAKEAKKQKAETAKEKPAKTQKDDTEAFKDPKEVFKIDVKTKNLKETVEAPAKPPPLDFGSYRTNSIDSWSQRVPGQNSMFVLSPENDKSPTIDVGHKKSKKKQMKKRDKKFEIENINQLRTGLESFTFSKDVLDNSAKEQTLVVASRTTEASSVTISGLFTTTQRSPAVAAPANKDPEISNFGSLSNLKSSSSILRPSILAASLDIATNKESPAQQNDRKSSISSRDPRLNKNIHTDEVDQVPPETSSRLATLRQRRRSLADVTAPTYSGRANSRASKRSDFASRRSSLAFDDDDDDNYLTAIAKRVNDKIMSAEDKDFNLANDGFELANSFLDMDDPFGRPGTSMSVRSAPNFNDDRSNMDTMDVTNTDLIDMDVDDDMSVYTTFSQDTTRSKGGRRRRRRRSVLLTRKPKKTNVNALESTETYDCVLCNKTFAKPVALSKHQLTIAHVSKVSEQEYLIATRKREEAEKAPPLAASSPKTTTATPTPTIAAEIPKHIFNLAPAVKPQESIIPPKVAEVHEKLKLDKPAPMKVPYLPPNSILNQSGIEPISSPEQNFERYSTTKTTSRLTLNPDERLFYECCNILKGSETPLVERSYPIVPPTTYAYDLQVKPVTPKSANERYSYIKQSTGEAGSKRDSGAYPRLDVNQFSDISSDSNPACAQPPPILPANYAQMHVLSGAKDQAVLPNDEGDGGALRSNVPRENPVLQMASLGSPTSVAPLTARTFVNQPSQLGIHGMEGPGSAAQKQNFISPLHSASSQSSTITTTTCRLKTKAAMKGYDNLKVSIPTIGLDMEHALERSPRPGCKLTTLAEIALGTETPMTALTSFTPSMQMGNDQKAKNKARPNDLADGHFPAMLNRPNDMAPLLKKREKSPIKIASPIISVHDTESCMPIVLSPPKKPESINAKDIYEFDDSENTPISKAIQSPFKIADDNDAPKKTIIIPERPFKNIGMEEKEGIKFQKPETPAINDENTTSTVTYSDRDDFVYGSISGGEDDNDNDNDNEDNKDGNLSSESSNSSAFTAKTFENKSLIMGRIFKNAKTKPKIVVEKPKLPTPEPPKQIPKQELDRLFDTLRGLNENRQAYAAREDRMDNAPNSSRSQSAKRKPAATAKPSKPKANTSKPNKRTANKEEHCSKEIAKLHAELGMSPAEIAELIGEGQRKSQRRCAVNRPKKLVEIWSSDEFEEFLSTKDIIALIEEKEQKTKRKKKTSTARKSNPPPASSNNDTKTGDEPTTPAVRLESEDDKASSTSSTPQKTAKKSTPNAAQTSKATTEENAQKHKPAKSKKKASTFVEPAAPKPLPKAQKVVKPSAGRRNSIDTLKANSSPFKKPTQRNILSKPADDSESDFEAELRRGSKAGPIRNRRKTISGKLEHDAGSSSGGSKKDSAKAKSATSRNTKLSPPDGQARPQARRKRIASEMLYYWSSSSDEEFGRIESTHDDEDHIDESENYQQHGWIVGDSHKKLVTLLAIAKGTKKVDDCGVKEINSKKKS